MIKYNLGCRDGHEFESWFRTIADYDTQSRSGAVECPLCGSTEIAKQPMAPAVVSKRRSVSAGKQPESEAQLKMATLGVLRALKKAVLENTEDVGAKFADEARKIHFGEAEERNIRGSSTATEAQALVDDEISFGIVPSLPEELN